MIPKKTATACSWRNPAFSSFTRTLPSSASSDGRSDWPSFLAAAVTFAWKAACRCATPDSEASRSGPPSMSRRSRSSARRGRSDIVPSATQVPSVIVTNTASGISMSWDNITSAHTLIATIFLIDQAPSTCSTDVTVSSLVPIGVEKRTLM